MIAIIDCEIGNLRSVQKGFEKVGYEASITYKAPEIDEADAVVLPGVGAFRDAMDFIKGRGLDKIILKTTEKGKPLLGICLGLQLLLSWSEEGGRQRGLDIIRGEVVRLPNTVKVPEMGWNNVKRTGPCPIFERVPENAYFYFAHSYYAAPEDRNVVAGTTDYGVDFSSVICRDNIYGVQFHPEKSGAWGLQILKNFGQLMGVRR
ncbi:MAG: imidazole glycerol phosphate synthase subunit HisH [Actinomycetota bacterium]